MSMNCHDTFSQQYPYYNYWGDVLTASAGDATGYLYYLNDQTKIAAVRTEVGEGRIIYQGFGFEVIGNNQSRSTLMKNSLDWLMGESTSAGVLSLASDMVDFGSVQVGESSVESIRTANTGTGPLTINSIDIISDDGGVFTVTNSDELPKTIAPSTIWDITIMFEPDAAGDFSGTVRINSDGGTEEATVNGVGEAGSVKDGVYGIDGIFTMKAGPNPFSDYTTITYNVGGIGASNVMLNVIDATGRVVAELVNKTQAPGEYTIDLNGAELSSGTYYVIARVGEMTERMPVVIAK